MKFQNFLLIVITLLITVALVEAGLHLIDYPPAPDVGWRWEQSPYRATFNEHDQNTNQLGLRGRKIIYGNDDFVILLAGGFPGRSGFPDKR